MKKKISTERINHLAPPFVLLLLTFTFHYSAISQGELRWDDSTILKQVLNFPKLDFLYIPEAWRSLGSYFFTPWVTFSFSIDHLIFGLNFTGYYVHHLFSLWLTTLATYYLFSLWIRRINAFLACTLFLIGSPTVVIAQQLMTRHYIEGLLFAIIALYLFIVSARRNDLRLTFYGAFFYFLSMAAKETYVPLFALLFFLSLKEFKQNFKHLLPFALSLLTFAAWRWYMLGELIGGYKKDIIIHDFHSGFLSIFQNFFGYDFLGQLIIGILAMFFFFYIFSNKKKICIVATSILLLFAPLFAVGLRVETMHLRIVFLVWWAIVLFLALCVDHFWEQKKILPPKKNIIIFLIFFSMLWGKVFYQSKNELNELRLYLNLFDSHSKYILESDQQEIIIISPYFYKKFFYTIVGLIKVKRKTNKDYRQILLIDEIVLNPLDSKTLNKYSLIKYNEDKHTFENHSLTVTDLLNKWRSTKKEKALTAQVNIEGDIIKWAFGPYRGGKYSGITIGDGGLNAAKKFQMLPTGKTRSSTQSFSFYLRYDSPEGWTTYSPLLKCSQDKPVQFYRQDSS